MTERLHCIVPGCQHSRLAKLLEGPQWICGDHWLAVPKAFRRVWHRQWRRLRRKGPNAINPIAWGRLWSRLKRAAIERAGGIG